MKEKIVRLENPFDVSLEGPYQGNSTFDLKVLGRTSKGNDLTVYLKFPVYYVEFIARRLHEVIQKEEKWLNDNKNALKGDL